MLKVENLIKNTPSKLHHIHQRRGLLRTPLKHLRRRHLQKQQKDTQSLTAFAKNSITEVWRGS